MNVLRISVRSAVHDRSALIFLFLRFSAFNELAGFDGKILLFSEDVDINIGHVC